ncbi:MAG: hypothetical protein ACKVOH_00920 [Chlamydiales bacterium]
MVEGITTSDVVFAPVQGAEQTQTGEEKTAEEILISILAQGRIFPYTKEPEPSIFLFLQSQAAALHPKYRQLSEGKESERNQEGAKKNGLEESLNKERAPVKSQTADSKEHLPSPGKREVSDVYRMGEKPTVETSHFPKISPSQTISTPKSAAYSKEEEPSPEKSSSMDMATQTMRQENVEEPQQLVKQGMEASLTKESFPFSANSQTKPMLARPQTTDSRARSQEKQGDIGRLSGFSVTVLTQEVKKEFAQIFYLAVERGQEQDKEQQQDKEQEREGQEGKTTTKTSTSVQKVAIKTLFCGSTQESSLSPKAPKAEIEDFQKFLYAMMQDSDLSAFFECRVSHFDVLILFIEIMKLDLKNQREERIARIHERQYQIEWMEKVVKQHKQQANFLLFAGIGAGVLGVVSGLLPIVGHMKGDWLLSKLKGVFTSLEGMKRTKAFDNFSKMAFSMSEMNKAMGQVQSSFCEGERSWAEHKANLHRSDGEENTRTLEDSNREYKTWNDVLSQILRMEQDLTRALYQ